MSTSDYSKRIPGATLDITSRTRKAKLTLAVLRDFLGTRLAGSRVLDAAASGGIIADFLAQYVEHVIGIDIDANAIGFGLRHFRRGNLALLLADATRCPFRDESFDVVICSHLYEHVPDATQLMNETARVLKPGGICYFAAGNRLNLVEPHYSLPFLSVIPKAAAHYYLRLTGRGRRYEETHLTLWGLRRLVRDFKVIDYTDRIVGQPARFNADHMLRPNSPRARLARMVCRHAYWLMPGYIWILQKSVAGADSCIPLDQKPPDSTMG